jgi:hypothetical protein
MLVQRFQQNQEEELKFIWTCVGIIKRDNTKITHIGHWSLDII